MIKVNIKKSAIIITGHSGYDEYGKDIVCASVSSIVITSVNAALKLENNSLEYIEEKDKLTINILSNKENIKIIIENMIDLLEELSLTYKENIKIIKEERPWILWN